MKLDLRKNGTLDVDFIKKINQLEPTVRDEYSRYIGDLTESNNFQELDWLLDVSCRNTYSSKIHDHMCKLALLESMIKEGRDIEEVLVDDDILKNIVNQLLSIHDVQISVNYLYKQKNIFFKVLRNIIISLYLGFNEYISARLVRSKSVTLKEIILLENFIFEDSFDDELNLSDKYYPGIMDYFSQDEVRKVWYLSSIIGIKHLHERMRFLRKVNLAKDQILIKEHYLRFSDYISAFFASFIIPTKINHIPKWRNIDISKLILTEAYNEIGSYSLISNILYYKFFRRLKNNDIDLKFVIDWNENQVIDRALNLGMRKYFPNTTIKGYQGFVISDYYASLTPTKFEIENGLIPHELYVISKYLVDNRKKYCPDLNVLFAPAFRYVGAIKYHNQDLENKKYILVGLPMLHEESRQVLKMLLEAVKDIEIDILVKRHPTILLKNLLTNVSYANDPKLKFTEKN